MNSKLSLGVLSVLGGYIFVCDNLCNRWTIKMQNKPNFNRHSSIDNRQSSIVNRQSNRWFIKAKNGNVLDNFGVLLEQFGVIVDKLGVVLDNVGSIKTPKNRIFSAKNDENTKLSHLISSKTPPPRFAALPLGRGRAFTTPALFDIRLVHDKTVFYSKLGDCRKRLCFFGVNK